MPEDDDLLDRARAVRRAVLGDAYVDAQVDDPNPALRDLQDHVTRQAWGAWAREGPLTTRDRSLLVLAMTAALGRFDEFELHASATERTGVTDDELDELLFQIAGYCGAPTAVSATRALQRVRAARQDR